MKQSSQHEGVRGKPPVGGSPSREEPARLWLVGSVSIVLLASVIAGFLFSSGRQPSTREPVTSGAGGAGSTAPPALRESSSARTTAVIPQVRQNTSSDEEAPALQVPVETFVPADNEPPQFDANTLSNPTALRGYLTGANPILAEAVLQAASRQDKKLAAQCLLDIVSDGTEPRRLDVLQRLSASPYVDDATKTAALSTALRDPDYGLVTAAVRELSGRTDASALGLLQGALDRGDRDAKLFILESLAGNSSAQPLLEQALNDPEAAVRQTAQLVLSLRNQANTGTSPTLAEQAGGSQ